MPLAAGLYLASIMEAEQQENNVSQQQRRRQYHKKTRTGCLTCKIRKLRCDEQKPACNRCVSTGRKCDGYVTPPDSPGHVSSTAEPHTHVAASSRPSGAPGLLARSSTMSPNPRFDLKLVLPRNNLQEVRSYRFFLDVTAPSIAGVFDVDFWLGEIPRACHADSAIWHAVVSLGAIYEAYTTSSGFLTDKKQTIFALQQFNASIKSLTQHPTSQPDKWRALTASTIFTWICGIQGLHQEARIHLKAGTKLLQEIERDDTKKKNVHLDVMGAGNGHVLPNRVPISIRPLRSILNSLEVQARAFDNGGLAGESSILAESDAWSTWRLYRAPQSDRGSWTAKSIGTPPSFRYATQDNYIRLNQAAESLLNGLLVWSQRHATDMRNLIASGGDADKLAALIVTQEPYSRSYSEIKAAIHLFETELSAAGIATGNAQTTPKALLTAALFRDTIRLILVHDSDIPDQMARFKSLPGQHSGILDLAERILRLDNKAHPAKSFTPTPSMTQPICLVYHSGFPQATRRRAIELLRCYPRREGLWDSLFAAGLGELIMDREQELLGRSGDKDTAEDMEVPLLTRMFSMRVVFQGERKASIRMLSWDEWIAGKPGVRKAWAW